MIHAVKWQNSTPSPRWTLELLRSHLLSDLSVKILGHGHGDKIGVCPIHVLFRHRLFIQIRKVANTENFLFSMASCSFKLTSVPVLLLRLTYTCDCFMIPRCFNRIGVTRSLYSICHLWTNVRSSVRGTTWLPIVIEKCCTSRFNGF